MAARRTRRQALELAALAGTGALAGGIVLGSVPDRAASQQSSPERDVEILNRVLLMEYVHAGFYADALRRGRLTGELREFAREVGSHEEAHIEAVREALGGEARERPRLDFGEDTGDPERFASAAMALEDLAVGAYNAGAADLSPEALAAAARIVSVEARHAAWIRDINGEDPAPFASEPEQSAEDVDRELERRGYVRP